jgi:two-component system NtrC family sensor kinase
MIVAMSSFRVANGMEAEVAHAFLNRPHLVEGTRGYLGMETFTDSKDSAVFHLITRWTDADSFHTWHRGAAHHHSHEFIPSGLKLDSSYTKVVEMERIGGHQPDTSLQEMVADQGALLSSFLRESECVHLLAASSDGLIVACNQRLARSMECATEDLRGSRVWSLLTADDAARLQQRIASGERKPDEKFLLNFVDPSQSPHTLLCKLDVQPGGFVLIAEDTKKQDDALHNEMLQLNNDLAVLTRENVRKKRELQATLEQLKRTQAMLVHREKMASLGQMTAGVAHEINNPVAFVLSNHATLQKDFEALLSLINLVGDSLDEIGRVSPALRERIVAKGAAIELSYLAEAVPRKIADNLEGLDRIKNIVLELRNFSRLDEDVRKPAVVSEGIVSTLRFLAPMMADRGVSVQTTFAEMPELICSPGPLNQVFSNIIANAVQACSPGQVVNVSTALEGDICVVTVEDQGAGISAENLAKVFDPFFTTKPVGEGTGLGLHIVHQIVTAHGGEIKIGSQPGRGTRVRVELPLRQNNGEQRPTRSDTL